MFERLGFSEILFIGAVFFLFFGAKRLPEMGASIGKGIREFKRSLSEINEEVTSGKSDPSSAPRQLDAPATPSSGGEPKRLSQ
jgi:sec-independent protein translocase protein TatA